MRPCRQHYLETTTQPDDPAWPLVQGWVAEAKHPVEILSPAETAGESLVSIQATNFGCGMVESETPPSAVLIADDVLGGFFALNGGRFAAEGHSVWYFAPDTLRREDTEKGYSDFGYWSHLRLEIPLNVVALQAA